MKNYLLMTLLVFTASCNNNPNSKQVKERIDSVIVSTPMPDTMQMHKMKMLNPMLESMMATMKKMDTLKMNNDFDLDFANSMIIHHQAAIDMSVLEIATGKNAEIISMAKNIVTSQKGEIAEIQKFILGYKSVITKTDNSDSENKLEDAMKNMMLTLNSMKLLGDADDNYVMLMIAHHGTAIQMAKDEITFGKQKQIKKMAEKIIAAQTTEINKFVRWTHLR
jgi:uncharacterized protein (DUF305 family)